MVDNATVLVDAPGPIKILMLNGYSDESNYVNISHLLLLSLFTKKNSTWGLKNRILNFYRVYYSSK